MKKIGLFLTCFSIISIGCAHANYSRCQEYYTSTGLIRDCQETYVSQVVYPMVPPAPPQPPIIYNARPYYGGIYPRVGLNLNFGSRHHHAPMMRHGMPRGHHHGGFGAGLHISI